MRLPPTPPIYAAMIWSTNRTCDLRTYSPPPAKPNQLSMMVNNVREERVWPRPMIPRSRKHETEMLRVLAHRTSLQGVHVTEWLTGRPSQCLKRQCAQHASPNPVVRVYDPVDPAYAEGATFFLVFVRFIVDAYGIHALAQWASSLACLLPHNPPLQQNTCPCGSLIAKTSPAYESKTLILGRTDRPADAIVLHPELDHANLSMGRHAIDVTVHNPTGPPFLAHIRKPIAHSGAGAEFVEEQRRKLFAAKVSCVTARLPVWTPDFSSHPMGLLT
jgi:hypothetical protein